MITVVTSIHKTSAIFIDAYIKSILKTQLVKECILVVTDRSLKQTIIQQSGITFKIVRLPPDYPYREPGAVIGSLACQDHGYGLSYGASLATQEYIMFCDHDVYFYLPVDKIYLSLMEKHSLDVIGLSHFSPTSLFFHYFPTVINMLVRKDKLPDAAFFADMKKISSDIGDVLSPPGSKFELAVRNGPMRDLVPAPERIYDTGSLLYFWALKNNWRWLSFQTRDTLNYDLGYCRGNIADVPRLKGMNFLYHESNKEYDKLRAVAGVSVAEDKTHILSGSFSPHDFAIKKGEKML